MEMRRKILVVDDEPTNILLMQSYLQAEYDVITALNGYEAISQAKAGKPDLILLDVMMPDLDGFDVCHLLKADKFFATVPIIFLTALDSTEGELRGLDEGGTDYLTKPINFVLLKLRIRNHLALKSQNELVMEQKILLQQQKAELKATLSRLKILEGIIPICMYCKNIRNDTDAWEKLEAYLSSHTNAQLSHGICPDCLKTQFPQYAKKNQGAG
jgi:DNA-binding response OmpR family regulator